MTVYYDSGLVDLDEALEDAVTKVICPDVEDENHECRLHFISWQTKEE
jgi:hypothetical protein